MSTTLEETLAPLATEYLRAGVASGRLARPTAVRMGYRLDRFSVSFGARPINQLTAPVIDRWLETIGHLALATRRGNFTTIKTFCLWLVDRGLIKKDPTRHVRMPVRRTVPRAFTRDQVAAVLEVLPDRRAELIVRLMVDMGLRCVEVSRIEFADYDPVGRTMLVTGKAGHQRVLPVVDTTAWAIEAYRLEHGARTGPLVRSYNHPTRGVSAGHVSALVADWMKEAGIKGVRFDGRSAHALRHTAASDVLEQCGDLRVVQEMLGHTSLTTTQVYLRRAGLDRMRDAMAGRAYGAST